MKKLDQLLSPVKLGNLELKNRVVMAPMTRSRAADDDCVTDLHVDYYSQRAGAGMIITEGVQPSVNGKGYCRTPGIYNQQQVESWRRVTRAVHEKGGTIVCQLMHCGRVGSPLNKAESARSVAPSAIRCTEQIFSEQGMVDMPEPSALTLTEITDVIEEYRVATANALAAGFDGVELHGTSGYLPAQFLSTGTNKREDKYGGNLENRLRFVIEVLEAMISVAGAGRVGLRICPGNPFNDLQDDNPGETFSALLQRVNSMKISYLHVIRMAATGLDNIALAGDNFDGPIIANDSFDAQEAQEAISANTLAAVSFGRLFLANPDLVARFGSAAELNRLDPKTLYTPGPAGYTDYPFLSAAGAEA